MKIAMIGAGGWGTAMMIELAGRNNDLIMYCRNPARAEEIGRPGKMENTCRGLTFLKKSALQATWRKQWKEQAVSLSALLLMW